MELRKLVWNGSEPLEGGEQGSMGYNTMMPLREYETEFTHYEVPVTVWGDYVGSTVQRSNWRSLMRDYPDTFCDIYGGYFSHYLAIPKDDVTEDLMDIFEKLEEFYPLYDEEDHSALEYELAEEAWDQWLKADVLRDLDGFDVVVNDSEIETVQQLFYELTYMQDYGPECEDATSAHFPFYDQVIDTIKELYNARG